jgi:hypothetical protein
MKILVGIIIFLTGNLVQAGPAFGEVEIAPLSQRKSLNEVYSKQSFGDVYELRKTRRIGVGTQFLGPSGLVGANVELNFQPENSALISFGGGPGYNAFGFQWKHSFLAQNWTPHASVGYSHWYNSSPGGLSSTKTNPPVLYERWLTTPEKNTGEFQIDLLTTSIGISFYPLIGEWPGAAYFAEILFLTRTTSIEPTVLGSFGVSYYF